VIKRHAGLLEEQIKIAIDYFRKSNDARDAKLKKEESIQTRSFVGLI